MKKITLLFITLLLSNIIMAQLPTGSFFEFGFTGGSLANTSASGAPNFTGSINSITDRDGNANDAADITGPLSGASVGAANVNETTLCFWMKHSALTSNERIIQIYGAGGVGYRLQMTGSVLLYNGTIANTTSGLSASHQETVNIDDNAWHHIAVRTTLINPNTLEFDIFLDNVLLPTMSNTTIALTGPITRFIENGTLAVSPTNAYTGDIDDIYFYKSALTDAEITQIYNYNPCTVNIPDANFKANLVANTLINTNGDTEIQCSEASAFIGTINCNSSSISDLTGLEAFTSLNGIICNDNNLTTIDVSANTLLTVLQFNDNNLTSINTTNNPLLSNLRCHSNALTSLDLSSNTDLRYIHCYQNQISSLILPQSATLEELVASDNNLTTIDVSFNTGLELIELEQNQLSTINLSQNTLLESLYLRNNLFTSLDCSSNSVLDWIVVNDNPNMESIDVSNGNNNNVAFFWAHNSPNLTCIQVDDVTFSNTNWMGGSFNFDAASSFSLICVAACTVNIPDANFKAYLVGNSLININGNSEIECNEAIAFTGTMNCGSLSISDLTGIEAFTALTSFYCDNNSLTILDLSNNVALTTVECRNNSISTIDVSQNNVLEYLLCNNNSLTTLNVSQNNSLLWLRCNDNDLTNLDVSNNTNLTQLLCNNNALASLNVANTNNSNLLDLQALGNSSLTCIQHDSSFNPSSNANWLKDSTASWSTDCSAAVLVSSIIVQGSGGTSTITTQGGTLQMEATILPMNADDATYTWSVVNGTGSATISNTGLLTASADGTVEVIATANDASGVSGTKTITISNQSVGIHDLAFQNLSVYPNPTSNFINLNISEELSSIRMMDMTGKTVKVFSSESRKLDISEFTTGIYFLEIANSESKSIVKIIKD